MKRIVSVSIGSSSRDKKVAVDLNGESFLIERIGTDGSIKKAVKLIKELDGKIDVFGMGGIDLYLYGEDNKKYTLKAALPIAKAAKKSPIVDGSALKNTLERSLVKFINDECKIELKGKKVLLVCAMDRFGMAEEFSRMGSIVTYGDIMFAFGVPLPINNIKTLHKIASVVFPFISLIPFGRLYPTGSEQLEVVKKFEKYYNDADIIAGDFLYIKKYLPNRLPGKIIVTNTVTEEDIRILKSAGLKAVFTSTPDFDGRSFGTNVIEALLVCIAGKPIDEMTPEIFSKLIADYAITHRKIYFE